jgi:hypothetical protein
MINDALVISFDTPDADTVYHKYLVTCAMLGVEPTPRERAPARRRVERAFRR